MWEERSSVARVTIDVVVVVTPLTMWLQATRVDGDHEDVVHSRLSKAHCLLLVLLWSLMWSLLQELLLSMYYC